MSSSEELCLDTDVMLSIGDVGVGGAFEDAWLAGVDGLDTAKESNKRDS